MNSNPFKVYVGVADILSLILSVAAVIGYKAAPKNNNTINTCQMVDTLVRQRVLTAGISQIKAAAAESPKKVQA